MNADPNTNQLDAVPRNATQAITDPATLIEHILSRYHAVHRAQFPELIGMARRVEAVHQEDPSVPAGLEDLLESMEQDLLLHMQKEEAILFPMMKTGQNYPVSGPIHMMRADHINHVAMLEELTRRTNDATPPEGACNTWRALYAGIAQLKDDLLNHIHLENNVLFVQFETTPPSSMAG